MPPNLVREARAHRDAPVGAGLHVKQPPVDTVLQRLPSQEARRQGTNYSCGGAARCGRPSEGMIEAPDHDRAPHQRHDPPAHAQRQTYMKTL